MEGDDASIHRCPVNLSLAPFILKVTWELIGVRFCFEVIQGLSSHLQIGVLQHLGNSWRSHAIAPFSEPVSGQ